jgi:hypothetical protein
MAKRLWPLALDALAFSDLAIEARNEAAAGAPWKAWALESPFLIGAQAPRAAPLLFLPGIIDIAARPLLPADACGQYSVTQHSLRMTS